jgi:PAS domain S-box-containing protein
MPRPVSIPQRDALEIIADAKVAAYGMDCHDRIVYWNKGASRVLGWSPEEVLGKKCFDVLAGRDLFGNLYCMCACPNILSALTGNDTQPFLLEVKKKGSTTPVKAIVRAIPLPAAGPSFEVLMHFLEARDAKIDSLVAALRVSVREHGGLPRVDPPIPVSPLTGREREIIMLVANGHSTFNIAARLNVSHSTVRNHIQHILRKLEVHSQVEAVALSFRRGWL